MPLADTQSLYFYISVIHITSMILVQTSEVGTTLWPLKLCCLSSVSLKCI